MLSEGGFGLSVFWGSEMCRGSRGVFVSTARFGRTVVIAGSCWNTLLWLVTLSLGLYTKSPLGLAFFPAVFISRGLGLSPSSRDMLAACSRAPSSTELLSWYLLRAYANSSSFLRHTPCKHRRLIGLRLPRLPQLPPSHWLKYPRLEVLLSSQPGRTHIQYEGTSRRLGYRHWRTVKCGTDREPDSVQCTYLWGLGRAAEASVQTDRQSVLDQ